MRSSEPLEIGTLARCIALAALAAFGVVLGSPASSSPEGAGPAQAPLELDALVRRFSAMPGLSARFVEEKHLALLRAPLVSEGVLHYAPPDRIARRIERPAVSTWVVRGDELFIGSPDRIRSVDLVSQPLLRPFVETLRLVLTGDLPRLRERFEIAFDPGDGAQAWSLRLVPRPGPLREIVSSIEFTGVDGVLSSLRVVDVGGDETIDRFSEVDPTRRYSEVEFAQIFDVSHALNGRRIAVLLAFAVLTLAAAWVVLRGFQVSVGVTRFLVDPAERDLGAVAFVLTDSPQARTLLLAVSAPDLATATAAVEVWSKQLAGHPEVAELHAGPDPGFEPALRELYFPRRMLFLSTAPEQEIPALFSEPGLREAARRLRAVLGSPEGTLIKPLAAADPLLAFPTQLGRIEAGQAWSVRVRGGHFVAGDPPRAILLLTTVHSAFDADAQGPLLDFIAQSFEALDQRFGGALDLAQSGAHRFAVESERRAKSDAAWLSGVSLVLLIAFFYAIYRSLLVLALTLVPLVFGLLGATAVTLLVFGEVNALTLAFGGTLIGICTDYPLHLLSHCALRGSAPLPAVVRRLRTPLLLAVGTTATGFGVLASADLPGIREVGVFAVAGVGLALLSTLVLLPELIPDSIGPTRQQLAMIAWLRRVTAPGARSRRLALVAAAAAVAICAVGLPRLHWDDDVFALNVPLRPEWLREDAALRGLVSPMDANRFAVAIGTDDESALALDAAVAARLRDAESAGWIEGFRSVQSFIWPRELQERNRRAVAAEAGAAARLETAFEAEGFRAGAFEPFARALGAEGPPPLTLADLLDSSLRVAVLPYRVELADGRVALLTPLRGVTDDEALAAALHELENVHLFDPKRFASNVYGRYRSRSLGVVAAGALAVIALLTLRYRRFDRTAVAAAPAVLAALATLALLSLAGVALSLLHLLGVLLVLCLGVDYGIFLVESSLGPREDDEASLFSVVIDCLTTLLSFGLLSLSSFPALADLGTSTSLGICLSLLLVLCFRSVLPVPENQERGEIE